MNISLNLQKLTNKLQKIYPGCLITKQSCDFQSIIPLYYINKYVSHLNFSKYLYISLNNNLKNEYQNFKFSIYPEPSTIFYEYNNGRLIKGGIFKAVHINGQEINVAILYNSRIFLKWHFLKFLEINKIEPNIHNYQYNYINSDLYLHEIIFKIKNIDYENIYDSIGDVIMI
jgi:hypothetical protein